MEGCFGAWCFIAQFSKQLFLLGRDVGRKGAPGEWRGAEVWLGAPLWSVSCGGSAAGMDCSTRALGSAVTTTGCAALFQRHPSAGVQAWCNDWPGTLGLFLVGMNGDAKTNLSYPDPNDGCCAGAAPGRALCTAAAHREGIRLCLEQCRPRVAPSTSGHC